MTTPIEYVYVPVPEQDGFEIEDVFVPRLNIWLKKVPISSIEDKAVEPSGGSIEQIVTDEEINKAWGNANFGNISRRDVIIDTLEKVAQAWGTGRTAICIVKELGLVEHRNGQIGLSDKGLKYLLNTK